MLLLVVIGDLRLTILSNLIEAPPSKMRYSYDTIKVN